MLRSTLKIIFKLNPLMPYYLNTNLEMCEWEEPWWEGLELDLGKQCRPHDLQPPTQCPQFPQVDPNVRVTQRGMCNRRWLCWGVWQRSSWFWPVCLNDTFPKSEGPGKDPNPKLHSDWRTKWTSLCAASCGCKTTSGRKQNLQPDLFNRMH